MSNYEIQPFIKTATFTDTVYAIRINVIELVLGVSAKIRTEYFTENRTLYTTEDILEGDDYTAWGSDDTYIVNWVANKYGLVLIPSN